jgi:hypothetical protein
VLADANLLEEQCKDESGGMGDAIKSACVVLSDARSQKLCAIVMALLKNPSDADKHPTNEKIKAEVKDARAHQIKEDTTLPKCIFDKMMRTLSGR